MELHAVKLKQTCFPDNAYSHTAQTGRTHDRISQIIDRSNFVLAETGRPHKTAPHAGWTRSQNCQLCWAMPRWLQPYSTGSLVAAKLSRLETTVG